MKTFSATLFLCNHLGGGYQGGGLHDGFGGFDRFGNSGEPPALLLLVLQKLKDREATVAGLTILAVLAVMWRFRSGQDLYS